MKCSIEHIHQKLTKNACHYLNDYLDYLDYLNDYLQSPRTLVENDSSVAFFVRGSIVCLCQ